MAQIFKHGNAWAYHVWIDSKHSKSRSVFKRKMDTRRAAAEVEQLKYDAN